MVAIGFRVQSRVSNHVWGFKKCFKQWLRVDSWVLKSGFKLSCVCVSNHLWGFKVVVSGFKAVQSFTVGLGFQSLLSARVRFSRWAYKPWLGFKVASRVRVTK